MASIEELKQARIHKIALLKEYGMDPYAKNVQRTHQISEILSHFDKLSNSKETVTLVGRIMSIRGQGAILFVTFKDQTGVFQACLKKDEMNESLFNLFKDAVDGADFVSFSGTLFTTERGAQTILVNDWMMLTKALRQLPDKWHGIQDIEETYRKRYLDMVMDSAVFDRFLLRSKIISAIRNFFDSKDFVEIETPILENQAGGAMARVFNTHHNDYDMDMVLRIALELPHKILTVGGLERIYEIGKCFRNEGSDPTHHQEFTMIEWYAAYCSLEDNMRWTEELIRFLAEKVVGKTEFTVYDKDGNGVLVDFNTAWRKVYFNDLLKEYAHVSIDDDVSVLKEKALSLGMDEKEAKTISLGNLLDFIFKKTARFKLIHPTFVMNYPSDLKPLAIQNDDNTANVCQLVIGGAEITNQYAELVDPLLQRALLESQAKAKEGGDDEAMDIDERFLTAMEHGMPPMTGFGMGIDRLVAIFTEQKNLRDVIYFPIMRPKNEE